MGPNSNLTTTDGTQLDPKVLKVMSAIKQMEGGDYNNRSGDNGSSAGAFQWNNDNKPLSPGELPSHWKAAAKTILGDENAQMTLENQNKVAYHQILMYKNQGYSPDEIDALWNGAHKDSTTGRMVHNNSTRAQQFQQAILGQQSQFVNPNQNQQSQQQFVQPPQVDQTQATNDNQPTQPQKSFLRQATDFAFPLLSDAYDFTQGKLNKTPGQILGDTALTAMWAVPGLGIAGKAAEGAGLLARLGASGVVRGAGVGYGAGVASDLSQGKSLGESLAPDVNKVVSTATGGALGGVLGRFGTGASATKNRAIQDIASVLSPTTKLNKQITQKIAPELAQRTPIALTRQGLLSKYEAFQSQAGEKLGEAYDALPANAKVEVANLFDGLQKKIDALTINGVVPSTAQPRVNALQTMMKDLANIGVEVSPDGTQVFADVANVRSLRQILDDSIQASKKNFSPSEFDSARLAANKQLANSIRDELGQQFPDIGKLNKDYSFWSKASQVLRDTIERKTGQSGILRKMGEGVLGVLSGSTTGHPIIGAAIWSGLAELIHSPMWKTANARLKSAIAKGLENGDEAGLHTLIQQTLQRAPYGAVRGSQGLLNYLIPGQQPNY